MSAHRKIAEKYIFPLLLLIYPLLLINQGIDVTDTTYSLGNYRFMEQMDMTWVVATWLANVCGRFLMQLPYGDTLLGMNLYTGLILAAIGLLCYRVLSRWMPAWCVFLGEMIALGLCWCPTTILYNYLTYLLFAAGSLCFYQGLRTGRDLWLAAAGVCLGLNVMVRFSNLAEAGLIVTLWYACWVKKETVIVAIRKTGWCLAGYLAGFGSALVWIMIKYGFHAFGDMAAGLFGMSTQASEYTLGGMIKATADAYLAALGWLMYAAAVLIGGILLFLWRKGRWEAAKKVCCCISLSVLLRLYWGRGMFSFRYYNEGSVFQWMMLFLILTIVCCVLEIAGYPVEGDRQEHKILAVLVLMIVLLTPLGSNNYTYQNMNNLFLAAPYTIWTCWRIHKKIGGRQLYFPVQVFAGIILLMTLVQGVIFGCTYVFRDGIYGEQRDTRVENSRVLAGMRTSAGRAEHLDSLLAFWEKESSGEPVLFWGDVPGLSYILDIPSAIFTTWPEIPSNTPDSLAAALEGLEEDPDILMGGALEEQPEEEKWELIRAFIRERGYVCIFENADYQVYRAQEN